MMKVRNQPKLRRVYMSQPVGEIRISRYFSRNTYEYSSNNNIFPFVPMSADSVPSSKTNIFQSKLYTLIYCRHFRTYSRCAMFDEVLWRYGISRSCDECGVELSWDISSGIIFVPQNFCNVTKFPMRTSII
jgi:hypothetical protein